MYLNLYQKYMLELLDEYDGLLKRQLEFLTKYYRESHLRNVDGYVAQMAMFGVVKITEYNGEEAVVLPGHLLEADIIAAIDVTRHFIEHITSFRRARFPLAMQFYIKTNGDDMQEVNIYPVHKGEEALALSFVENYAIETNDIAKSKKAPAWIFLIDEKEQIKLLKPDAEYSFAVVEKGKTVFYEGKR